MKVTVSYIKTCADILSCAELYPFTTKDAKTSIKEMMPNV